MTAVSDPIYDNKPVMFGASPVRFILLCFLIPFGFGLISIMPSGFGFLGLIPSFIGVMALGAWYLGTLSNRLVITDRHIRHRRGLLAKNVKEIAIRKVKSVEVDQSPLQRMTDVGTVRIFTTGDIAEIVLGGLPFPKQVQAAVSILDTDE